ncbi:hypothetical protein BC567DRAFT_219655 [Phyllosticta citribraziliensis]
MDGWMSLATDEVCMYVEIDTRRYVCICMYVCISVCAACGGCAVEHAHADAVSMAGCGTSPWALLSPGRFDRWPVTRNGGLTA